MVKMFYRLIIIMPLTLLGVSTIFEYMAGEPLSGGEMFLAVLFAAFLPVISGFGNQVKIISGGGLLIIAAVTFFLARISGKSEIYDAVLKLFAVIGIAMALSAVGFVLVKVRAVRIFAAIAIVIALATVTFMGYYISKPGMALCVLYVLTVAFEEAQRKYRGAEPFDKEKYTVYTWPFAFLFFLIIIGFKAPDRSYDWALFIKLYERTKAVTIELKEKLFSRHSEDYNETMIGFSGDARIAGGVGGKGEEILKIVTSKRKGENIYLTGKIFGDFDGREWESVPAYTDNERMLDALMAECVAEVYGEGNVSDFIRYDSTEITFLPFSSKHVFAPSKLLTIEIGYKNFMPTEKDGAVFFDETKIINAGYKSLSLSVNLNPAALGVITSGEKAPDKAAWNNTLIRFNLSDVSNLSYEKAKGYGDYVRNRYLSKISLAGETAETLEKIKNSCDTDYERLKLLESSLKSMTYTREPGKLPAKVTNPESYLDYFLTESQQGYCVHFATAFCMMARAMGYPSRYVQGYLVPVTDSGNTIVDTSMAHAWSEVWLEGLGWVMFDPTPGTGIAGNSWATKEEIAAEAELKEQNKGNGTFSFAKPDVEIVFEKEEVAEETEETAFRWYIFVIPVAAFLVFAGIFVTVEILLARRRLKKASADDKAMILCRRNMNMLLFCKEKPMQGETLSEFRNRLCEEDAHEGLEFIPCYERILYSDKGVDAATLAIIEDSEKAITDYLKKNRKWLWGFYRLRSLYKK